MGAGAGEIDEKDGGIFGALVGGGDPIPGAATGGGKAEAGAELFVIGRLVEGFEVEGLETIDGPTFWPEAFLVRMLELESDGLNGGFVFVQLQKSFGEEFAQFSFDGVWLRIQKALQIGFIRPLELLGSWPGTEARYGSADSHDDDKQHSGDGKRTEDEDREFVHKLMILHL
jgi:hypothetical protein